MVVRVQYPLGLCTIRHANDSLWAPAVAFLKKYIPGFKYMVLECTWMYLKTISFGATRQLTGVEMKSNVSSTCFSTVDYCS